MSTAEIDSRHNTIGTLYWNTILLFSGILIIGTYINVFVSQLLNISIKKIVSKTNSKNLHNMERRVCNSTTYLADSTVQLRRDGRRLCLRYFVCCMLYSNARKAFQFATNKLLSKICTKTILITSSTTVEQFFFFFFSLRMY